MSKKSIKNKIKNVTVPGRTIYTQEVRTSKHHDVKTKVNLN